MIVFSDREFKPAKIEILCILQHRYFLTVKLLPLLLITIETYNF